MKAGRPDLLRLLLESRRRKSSMSPGASPPKRKVKRRPRTPPSSGTTATATAPGSGGAGGVGGAASGTGAGTGAGTEAGTGTGAGGDGATDDERAHKDTRCWLDLQMTIKGVPSHTAINLAALHGQPESVTLLLNEGADLNMADRDGGSYMVGHLVLHGALWPRHCPFGPGP